MKKLVLCFLIFGSKVFAQPATEWIKYISPADNYSAVIEPVNFLLSEKGNVMMLCDSISSPYLIQRIIPRFDSSGNSLLRFRIDSTENLPFVNFTHDQSMICLSKYDGINHTYLSVYKYDSLGNPVWSHQTETNYIFSALWSTALDANENLIAVGVNSTPDTLFIFKFDPLGNLTWSNSFGQPNLSYQVLTTSDAAGNLFLAVNFYPTSFPEATVIKYDQAGNLEWTLPLTYNGDEHCFVSKMKADNYGITYFTGTHEISLTSSETLVGEISGSGMMNWNRTFPLTGANNLAQCVAFDNSGSLYSAVAGDYESDVRKYNADGNLAWANTLEGDTAYWCTQGGMSHVQTQLRVDEGEQVFWGHTTMEGTVIQKFGYTGNSIWKYTDKSSGNPITHFSDFDLIGKDIFIVGYCGSLVGDFVRKLSDPSYSSIELINKWNSLWEVFPNPSSDAVCLHFSDSFPNQFNVRIFSEVGELFYEKENSSYLSIIDLPKGIYFLEISGKEFSTMKKLVRQ
ncbi:MAG TPA: T9SS type A sorting domain-containing protein [Chitinophagales bacterium]|nr:T9SS type A sorting domain-containing protein [Chitinophagales bacterium]